MYELPGTLFLLILSLPFFVGVREVWVARYMGHPVLSLLAFGHATRSVIVENQPMIDKNFPIRCNAFFIIF